MKLHIIDEAERCLKCKKPLCQQGCPIHTPIPQITQLLLENRLMEAGEILFANNAVRNLIRESKTYQIASVMQTNKRAGMQTMDDALYDLYMRKLIDADNAVTYAQDPVSMNKKVNFDF